MIYKMTNKDDLYVIMLMLWNIISAYYVWATIYLCLNQIKKNNKISFLCVFTYFILLSQSEWKFLFKLCFPIGFWIVLFRDQ